MKIILLLFMSLSVLTSFADEYKDPATNVIYTYDPTGSSAKVKSGEVYVDTDNAENVELLGFPGSPDAKESIVILERFVVDGKEYLVDRIGDYAFVHKDKILSVLVPPSVKSIGKAAFAGCASLSEVSFPDDLRVIDDWAFAGCHSLKELLLPNGLERIGFEAFSGCSQLESVEIPACLTSVGALIFLGCDSLINISVSKSNTSFDSRNNCNAIIETVSNKLLIGCKRTSIPPTVTSIGAKAFFACKGLKNLYIPESVAEIGEGAFERCINLTQLSLSEGLKVIRSGAFTEAGLSSITIPASVQSIESGAFYSPALTILTSLIEYPFEVQCICSQNQKEQVILRVPVGTRTRYEAIPDWNQFRTIEEFQLTAIHNLPAQPSEGSYKNHAPPSKYYDLQGRRLSAPPTRGMYIQDKRAKIRDKKELLSIYKHRISAIQ